MTAKPTITSVTRVLMRAGWPPARPGSHGFKVSRLDTGVIRVEYDPGPFQIDRDEALARMAIFLSAEGWFVTESDRLLVSGG